MNFLYQRKSDRRLLARPMSENSRALSVSNNILLGRRERCGIPSVIPFTFRQHDERRCSETRDSCSTPISPDERFLSFPSDRNCLPTWSDALAETNIAPTTVRAFVLSIRPLFPFGSWERRITVAMRKQRTLDEHPTTRRQEHRRVITASYFPRYPS